MFHDKKMTKNIHKSIIFASWRIYCHQTFVKRYKRYKSNNKLLLQYLSTNKKLWTRLNFAFTTKLKGEGYKSTPARESNLGPNFNEICMLIHL